MEESKLYTARVQVVEAMCAVSRTMREPPQSARIRERF